MEPTAADHEMLLLREALEFIGDLEVDDDALSPLDDAWAPLEAPTTVSSAETAHTAADASGSDPVASMLPEPQAMEAPTDESVQAQPTPLPAALPWPCSAASTKGKGNSTAQPPGNRSRNKRREELLYLRGLVGELQGQLTELRRPPDEAERPTGNSDDTPERGSLLVVAAWEQVAARQCEQRQRSEMENIKLKRLLEDQIQVGKSLERLLLKKRPTFEGTETPVRFEKRARHGSLSAAWDDHAIFHELLSTIESQYNDTPRVLARLFPVRELVKHRSVELVHDESLGMVLETTETHLLPFDYELAVQEFWSTMPAVPDDKAFNFHDVNVSEDEIKVQFQAVAQFGRTKGDLTVFMVDRRYREADRTVFVSSAYFDPTEIADTNMDGVALRHKGWIVFEPARAASSTTKAATRMTSYMVAVPEVFGEPEDRTRKVGTLTNFVMAALSIELESRQRAFENRLFDRDRERACTRK